MNPQPYGSTNATTTKIGLGGAFITASSYADGVATVRRAFELGVRYFDTSPMYCQGASQAVFGEALQGVTEDYLLATKLGYFADPSRYHSCTALITQFEENLRLLRRDHVDTLQLHEADFHQWWSTDEATQGRLVADSAYSFNDAPALQTLQELKAQGRCRFIGISGNTADNMSRVLQSVDIDTFLLAFNYDLIRRKAQDVLPIAKEKGCAKLIGAIFQRGLATAQPELLDNPPDWMTPKLATRYKQVYDLQKESGMSLAEMGVRYIADQPDIDTIIIGAKLPDEIEECVKAVEKGPLPEDVFQMLEGTMG